MKFLTIKETAERTGKSVPALQEWVRRNAQDFPEQLSPPQGWLIREDLVEQLKAGRWVRIDPRWAYLRDSKEHVEAEEPEQ